MWNSWFDKLETLEQKLKCFFRVVVCLTEKNWRDPNLRKKRRKSQKSLKESANCYFLKWKKYKLSFSRECGEQKPLSPKQRIPSARRALHPRTTHACFYFVWWSRKVKILFPVKEFDYHSLTSIFALKSHLCYLLGTKSCYFRYLWLMVRDI